MKNELMNVKDQNNQLINTGTGLSVSQGDTYLSESGFLYLSGVRKFGDLFIEEDMAKGTAVSYLAGVRVYDKDKTLIIDKRMEKGCHYEREKARLVVKEELINMLTEANVDNPDFNVKLADETIDKHLKSAYYSQTYKSIMEWYDSLISIGI